MPDVRPDEDGWVIREWLSPSCVDALVLILDEALRCVDSPNDFLAAKSILTYAARLYYPARPGQIPEINREGIVLTALLEVLLCCYTGFSRAVNSRQFIASFVELKHCLAGYMSPMADRPAGRPAERESQSDA